MPIGSSSGPPLAERLATVRDSVAEACRLAGREPAGITTIVVTKFHPASLVRELFSLGVTAVGENRHQEAQAKAIELADLGGLSWHFIGQLQSNKARQVAEYARVVHSIDRSALIEAFDRGTAHVDCFIQVNLTDDPARGGVAPASAEALAEQVVGSDRLRLMGVMAVAPLDEEPRAAFARLREVSERVQQICAEARSISAGMSGDFPEAIAEGATHLRIGTAITGNRPAPR